MPAVPETLLGGLDHGVTKILNDMKDAYASYICVLCGSVFSSRDYRWGACEENEARTNVSCSDWSCPVCGGVVVEYARMSGGGPSAAALSAMG